MKFKPSNIILETGHCFNYRRPTREGGEGREGARGWVSVEQHTVWPASLSTSQEGSANVIAFRYRVQVGEN